MRMGDDAVGISGTLLRVSSEKLLFPGQGDTATAAMLKNDTCNAGGGLARPITLPFAQHCQPSDRDRASLNHAAHGHVVGFYRNTARSVGDDEDVVSLGKSLDCEIAQMLGTSIDNVVVRTYPGPGHYGRSNGGNAGAEDEAVILSRAVGKPVRVQWMRPEDSQWSTQSPAAYSDVEIGLDASGKIVAYHGTFQIGQKDSPLAIGLRDHTMRTPGQFQQNFPRELAISEAAALAGADAIQFRIDHATEDHVIGELKAVREASAWETRPSPHTNTVLTGNTPARGRGVSMLFRLGTYWACVCEIAVTPATGAIAVEKYTIAVDPGIVVNPMQLKRQVEGGAVMGISHALLEEAAFDQSGITSRDWNTYPILKMADVPEIKVVLLNRPEVARYGGGSEAANALAAPAIAAALFDATGKTARRLPLKPAFVRALLKA